MVLGLDGFHGSVGFSGHGSECLFILKMGELVSCLKFRADKDFQIRRSDKKAWYLFVLERWLLI